MNDDLAPADSRPEPTTPAPKPEGASAKGESPTGSTPGSEPSTEGGSGTTSTSTGAPRRRRRRGGRGRARPKPEGSDSEAGSEAPEGSHDGSEAAEAGRASGSSGGRASSTAARPRSSGGSRRPPAKKETEPIAGDAEEGAEKGSANSEKGTAAAKTPRPRRRAPAKPKTGDAEAPRDDSTDADSDGGEAGEEGSESTSTGAPRRRRRRGGRGRGRGGGTGEPKPEGDEGGPSEASASGEGEEAKPRQRQKGGQKDSGGRQRSDQSSKGPKEGKEAKEPQPMSTRLSAKAQRGSRSSSPRGRRRDSLPLVRRVQDKVMVITEHGERDQIAVLEDRDLVQHYITRVGAHSMVGNIYMARVQNVLPGMEAAFLDIGRGRNAVLYAGEVNYDEEVEGQPQRIEHALKSGQAVMTQVTKDPIGGKGARLTAQVSLPGRYLVLVPNSQVFGISRRLPDEERKRLRSAVKKAKPDGHGIIVRTAAEGATEEALAQDVERLVSEWDEIAKKAKKAKAPSVLYEEPELTVRVVRDLFNDEEFKEMVTDSPRIHEIVTDYLRDVAPDLLPKVRLHEGSLSAFEEFHIVEQIHKALDRKVWLPSGGYLVIDRTEAMTVIDVNTGRYVGKHNLEDTITKINLEAVKEIVYQLRMRDIGGIIIIDFIDMERQADRDKVYNALQETLAGDRARTNILKISELGLVEMTRKRVRESLTRVLSQACPYCQGTGRVKSTATVCSEILRAIEREAHGRTGTVVVLANPTVADHLFDAEREALESIEKRLQIGVRVDSRGTFHVEEFEVHFGE